MKLLLLSNSTNAGEGYLSYPEAQVRDFLTDESRSLLFIPYAAVAFSYEEYEDKVKTRFNEWGFEITSIHHHSDPVKAVQEAGGIIVGGGNTFHLLHQLYKYHLLKPIKDRVIEGVPYIGWSAGSNITCPSIMTTNDMPIIEPKSFASLNLIPFQINPHYVDANPDGHAGETREQRIEEFLEVHPEMYVAGLREGTLFHIEDNLIHLHGPKPVRIFKKGIEPLELGTRDNYDFLLRTT